MGRRPSVRWNEASGRWMAWVRFPDGSRRKVERVEKAAAQRDLDELLASRAAGEDPGPRRARLASFGDVIDAWLDAGCPTVSPTKKTRHARAKSPNTIDNATCLARLHLRPALGKLWVDRTSTARLEQVFAAMAGAGYATSTIDRTWGYLNQACCYAVRQRLVKTNPASDVLLPAARPACARRALPSTRSAGSWSRPSRWPRARRCG